MSLKIYTDAASNLFKKILDDKKADIVVLPMTLEVGEKTYLCYKDDIDVEAMSKDFYMEMEKGLRPKTSLISPGSFLEAMENEVNKGNEVIYVSLAGGISGSYQSACLMASQLNEEKGKECVKVINSKTAGFGEGMIALYASKLAKEGKSLEEVYSLTEEYVNRVRSEFTVDSIKYLANTGRVSKIAAAIAGVLAIKPLLYGSIEGKIETTSKVHGRIAAIKTLANQVINYIDDKDSTVYIAHCNAIDDAKKLEKIINDAGIKNTEVYYYDLVTGAHVGPGTLAVFYEGKDRNFEKKELLITKVVEKIIDKNK